MPLLGTNGTSAVSATGIATALSYFHVDNYSAVADLTTLYNGAVTSGAAAFTSATAAFTAADVGKTILVHGAGAAGAHLKTTISAFVSATAVTLADNAGTTVSGAE